jgi:regulator of sirC expression with transglutaminase-like and TPR domain
VRASAAQQAPVQAFRALGLLRRRQGDAQAASAAFDQYLARAPQASDAALIRTYLTQLPP